MAPYDRDSFLAGLAAGRAMWRPRVAKNYILSYYDLQLIQSGQQSLYDYVADDYQYPGTMPIAVANNDGLCIESQYWGNRAYQFFKPISARARRVYITLKGTSAFQQYHQFFVSINDEQGVLGPFAGNFAGNTLRSGFMISYNMTAEQMNNQANLTFQYPVTDPFTCVKQTIVIDVEDVAVDSYIGFQNCDSIACVYEVWWE